MRTRAARFALRLLLAQLVTLALWAAPTVTLSQGAFSPVGSMLAARNTSTATLLGTGKVLFAGGDISIFAVRADASAELYEPTTNAFSPAASMATPRSSHTATLLRSGKVLI